MYGDSVLRKRAQDIEVDSNQIKSLSQDMFETMYAAQGIGLAAPQIGKSLRLFVVDGSMMGDEGEDMKNFKKVFVNPEIIEKNDSLSEMDEGCLSIPGVRERVTRSEKIRIKFFDLNWVLHEEEYEGMQARIIQHEYDHIEGILFTDYLTPLKRQLLKRRLTDISKGQVETTYDILAPMRR